MKKAINKLMIILMSGLMACTPVVAYADPNPQGEIAETIEKTVDEINAMNGYTEDTLETPGEEVIQTEEAVSTEGAEAEPTITTCDIVYTIVQDADDYPEGETTVVMMNGDNKKEVKLSGSNITVTVDAPATYSISFSGVAEGYEITNANGESTFDINAEEGGNLAVELHIQKAKTEVDVMALSDEKAMQLLTDFVNGTSLMPDNLDWMMFLDNYETYSEIYERYYIDAGLTGWEDLSNYARFLITETYTRFQHNEGVEYEDEDSFRAVITAYTEEQILEVPADDVEDIYNLYKDIIDFQYNYMSATGTAYPFEITEISADEVTGEEIDGEADEIIDEEEQNIEQEEKTGMSSQRKLIMLIVIAGAAIVIVFYVRRRFF